MNKPLALAAMLIASPVMAQDEIPPGTFSYKSPITGECRIELLDFDGGWVVGEYDYVIRDNYSFPDYMAKQEVRGCGCGPVNINADIRKFVSFSAKNARFIGCITD